MTPTTPPAPQQQAEQPSSLPIVAMVLSIIGVCIPLLGCAGLVMGVIGIVAAVRRPAYGRMAFSIVAVVVPCLTFPILAAIAIPNFMRFQARSKQSECKTNLKAALTAERAYHNDKDTYSSSPKETFFQPERGNRYLYRLGDGPLEAAGIAADNGRFPEISNDALDAALRQRVGKLGVAGTCPDCEVTIGCAGNIDKDDEIDVWSVSTGERTGPGGVPILPGEVYNHYNDVTDSEGE